MNKDSHRTDHLTVLAATALASALCAQGTPIGFAETWALAPDRAQAVATLIPGSEEWHYYHCRERLDAADFATVEAVLPRWIERHGRTPRVVEIENRLALLSFDANPAATYAFLRQRLGLRYDHQRVVPGEKSDLPTRLDPNLLSSTVLTARALQLHPGTVNGFTDRALASLAQTNLDARTLANLLERLDRPDIDNLPALLVQHLEFRGGSGFGSVPVHRLLRRAQLDECARLLPSLLQDRAFVDVYLNRLRRSTDQSWQLDPDSRLEQLRRLWEFAQRLPSVHNSLKAHVLFHFLRHGLSQGAPDKDHFRTYIRLPRRQGHASEAHLKRHQRGDEFVNCATPYATGLPPIGDDTAIVRACLEHFFAREATYEAYAEFLDANWLKMVLAETKILLGQGDMERWSSMLGDPQHLERLEQRVEIEFAPTTHETFRASDKVVLEVDIKNVPVLLVKVFAIDSYRFHQEKQAEIDATAELDGVAANFEQTFNYTDPKLRRVRRTFDLPILSEAGTYVVEFVGNGLSSRAVIHKGWLRHVERTTAAGHVFRVYDESGAFQKDAIIWFGGREYHPDETGETLLPFTSTPGEHKVVLRQGNRSSLATFQHRSETYSLYGSAHVDRESLVSGMKARLVVRPELRLGQHEVSLKLLTQPALTILATNIDGLETKHDVRDLTLRDERELVHEFTVPERLARVQVSLSGRVRDLSGQEIDLTTQVKTFAVNGMDATAATNSINLLPTTDGYVLEIRGKDGEIKAGRACRLVLHHRDYRHPIDVTLQSDGKGRITLGALSGVDSLDVHHSSGFVGTFALHGPLGRLPLSLHGLTGETLRIPYQGTATAPSRAEFSLLGTESDAFDHLALVGGFLELRNLAAGEYELHLHEDNTTIPVRITQGRRDGRWLVGSERILGASDPKPLQIRALEVAGDTLLVRLSNPSTSTRVHLSATRTIPAFDPFLDLFGAPAVGSTVVATEQEVSSYHSGRQLGDEYRYVLERRYATKYAGNMLRRPSLLLNPWSINDSWNDAIGLGGGSGGRFGAARGGRSNLRAGGGGKNPPEPTVHPGSWANMDYLPRGAVLLSNLTPDADGVVRVPADDLGSGQLVHVVAIDGNQILYDRLIRPEQPLAPRPRHLPKALDGAQHFVEEKRIEFVNSGSEAILADARSAEVEVYDSLASVHRLLTTISRDPSLGRFAFVLQWPTFDAATKQQIYTQYACHELHFFIHQKDPEFFTTVVRPLLLNKLHKTFLDQWLLGENLQAYLEPRSFERLNLIEKILLAKRLDGDARTAITRALREELELRPPSVERLEALFELALKSNALANEPTRLLGGLAASDAAPEPKPAATPQPAESAAREPTPADDARQLGEKRKEADHNEEEALEEDQDKNLADEMTRRGKAVRLYREVMPTQRLVEHNYWSRTLEATTPDVVPANQFWMDYALAPAGQPFASAAVVEAGGSFLESMMALSVLDLPFTTSAHEIVTDGDRRTLRAASPLLLVRKEVAKTDIVDDSKSLLLGENFFRIDDRYTFDSGPDGNGERRDRFVTDEFLVDVAYGCHIVVTNPTSSRRTAELLLQIPEGSLPLNRGFWTRGLPIELQPYSTATIEYAFYFPAPGTFPHYPAHASEKGKLTAHAEPRTMRVVETPTRIDTTSWEHVSQQGYADAVFAFIDRSNLRRLDLDRLAWRLSDRDFFGALIEKLRARHAYQDTLWSYALLHQDASATREFLRHQDAFLNTCGAAIQSPLVTIDPVERRHYQHVELDPLVHSRAHPLGNQRRLGNADLARQYSQLMNILGYHPKLDSGDWLVVTYYLLLQDRVEEGLQSFAKIDPTRLATQLQYDYLRAYLCFFTGDTATARTTAERYREHPVAHWRGRFADVLSHLDEAEGKVAAASETTPDGLAATAPALELLLEGRQAKIAYRNLDACEVRYYELDVEFAFSAQPFARSEVGSAAFVQPTLKHVQALPQDRDALLLELPTQFHQKNVLVEVRGAGLVRSQTYFSNALAVRFLESYGQLAVSEPETNTPLPKTYVKVFAKLDNGTVRFHKDGYTDIRGRFDYASLSDDPNSKATRYAVLVLNDERGAVIREVTPPAK